MIGKVINDQLRRGRGGGGERRLIQHSLVTGDVQPFELSGTNLVGQGTRHPSPAVLTIQPRVCITVLRPHYNSVMLTSRYRSVFHACMHPYAGIPESTLYLA